MSDLHLPDRNEPCYCGSGRKFKKCCWPVMENCKADDTRFGEMARVFALWAKNDPNTEQRDQWQEFAQEYEKLMVVNSTKTISNPPTE